MTTAFESGVRHRVLIADDDVDLLDAIAKVVEEHGDTAIKVRDGVELMEALAATDYDLVITDIAMPAMTGVQASHSARYAGLATPILVITALDDPSLDDRVAALGKQARLLRKPFALPALEREIDLLLGPAP